MSTKHLFKQSNMEIIIVIYLLCDTRSENRMSVQVVVGNGDSNQKSRDFHYSKFWSRPRRPTHPLQNGRGLHRPDCRITRQQVINQKHDKNRVSKNGWTCFRLERLDEFECRYSLCYYTARREKTRQHFGIKATFWKKEEKIRYLDLV